MIHHHPKSWPPHYLVDERFELRAVGRWGERGLLEVWFDGKPLSAIKLPAAEWAALALLMEAALKSQDNHWAAAFVPPRLLAAQLLHRADLGGGDTNNLYQVVHKLRALLDGVSASKSGDLPAAWGYSVIETGDIGYRVSASPARFKLLLLGDDSRGAEACG